MMQFGAVTPRLPVLDLRATLEFYTRRLGFEIDVAWPHQEPTFVILRRGGARVGFFEPNEHWAGSPGYAELYIEVAGVSELHADLATRMPIEWGPEVYSYGRREFAVLDPDRYLLIFTEVTADPPSTFEPG